MAAPSSAQLSLRASSKAVSTAAYVLRKLISDVPLSAEGQTDGIVITCVEVLHENLYVGTSAAEILHFVQIPSNPDAGEDEGSYILASRLEPVHSNATSQGVQQILLLPKVNKACILCNNTLSFYSLPELSPAFPNTKPLTCSHVGGVDENIDQDNDDNDDGAVILVCQKSRMRLVRVNEDGPRSIRSIEYGGCLATARRGDVACSADAHSYALLDVEHQQKVPLFPISSQDAEAENPNDGSQDISEQPQSVSRSVSSASAQARASYPQERTHGRSTSLGIFGDQRRLESPRPLSARYGFDAPDFFSRSRSPFQPPSPERSPERSASPAPPTPTPNKPLPAPPAEATSGTSLQSPPKKSMPLKPLVVSPTPNEFLLTTGTTPADPGVGLFVNMDGDVVRGTIEFSAYPSSLVVDGQGLDPSASLIPGQAPEEGFVLAAVTREVKSEYQQGIEIQRWDENPEEHRVPKEWLDLTAHSKQISPSDDSFVPNFGLRTIASTKEISMMEIGHKLVQKRLDLTTLFKPREETGNKNAGRTTEDKGAEEFARHLSQVKTRIVLWVNGQIWWMVRNSLVLKLDARLAIAESIVTGGKTLTGSQRQEVISLLNDIRGMEVFTEVNFLGLSYIRQKASVLLFMDLIVKTAENTVVSENEKSSTEEALVGGEVDPRLILALLPVLRDDVIQGPEGISISGGLQITIETFLQQWDPSEVLSEPADSFTENLFQLVKRYLMLWRQKKGMASIADDKEVFQTVDSALLHVLLLLDRQLARSNGASVSLRAELNGVVDGGVDCFDRAVSLLQSFKRLYVLSRLYQSKHMSAKVLATWRRIVDGESDPEFTDGEQAIRKYLAKIRDKGLVEEYGTWLANRNPELGVQVFADDSSKVKFEPSQAISILKAKAPDAVKHYLEHLVFGKKLSQYSNDLITFYLDNVTSELESSKDSRSILLQTYETYRALRPSKPTYRQFIIDNAIDVEWWNSRLRLLQLLGGNYGGPSSYDLEYILTRLAPYEQELVPEMIILNGRRGRHEDAIRLLTHGLGDFDTAISYCLLGGSSIFRPAPGSVRQDAIPSREEQAKLFGYLLHEFLRIDDLNERIERTSELLDRFGSWFDLLEVLAVLPDSWSVEIFSGFLISGLRRLVRERSESNIKKALSGAQNLKTAADIIEKMEDLGPVVERVQ